MQMILLKDMYKIIPSDIQYGTVTQRNLKTRTLYKRHWRGINSQHKL